MENPVPLDIPGRQLQIPDDMLRNSRRLVKTGLQYRYGDWLNHPEYFRHDTDTQTLVCRRVCWLFVHYWITNVTAGVWQPSVLMKFDNIRNLSGKFEFLVRRTVNNADTDTSSSSFVLENSTTNFLSNDRGSWVRIHFEPIRFQQNNNRVGFKVFGPDNNWCSGIHFAQVQLQAVGIDWQKEKLLLYAMRDIREDETQEEGEPSLNVINTTTITTSRSLLDQLPNDILVKIASFLITPLPHETLLCDK